MTERKRNLLSVMGPGILVAATGVGAGDLATGAFAGIHLGIGVLWAVILGAFLKFLLSEGLTRWQLATGSTLLEGTMGHLGRLAQYGFFIYLLIWTFLVAAALMSACGATAQAILPFSEDPSSGKTKYGILFSLIGLFLVRLGGFRLFEKVMSLCIVLMFITVVITAFLLRPSWDELAPGLFWPSIPKLDGEGLPWTIALIGGVGGTVTVLCYGYWIREKNRLSIDDLRICRIDLGIGYAMTALFGLAMVVIGSTIEVEGRGATLVIKLSSKLGEELGPMGQWAFLLGALGAVFSSLLGVWQSIPYLFADLWGMMRSDHPTKGRLIGPHLASYRWYLYGMAVIPMIGLWVGFAKMQQFYAIFGALFIPMLAGALLLLNGRAAWIGVRYRNGPIVLTLLVITLVFFLAAGWLTVRNILVA